MAGHGVSHYNAVQFKATQVSLQRLFTCSAVVGILDSGGEGGSEGKTRIEHD